MELTDTIRAHAEKKADKLPRYYDGVQSVEVVVEPAKNDRFEAEVRVDVEKHDTFVAKCEHEDVYIGIDQCVDKVARQLSEFKEKLKNSKR